LSDGIILMSGIAVLAITLLISYDVLMRYFLDQPQLFVDELTSFLLVGVIFWGTAPTFLRGGHIRVDLLTNRLGSKLRRRMRIISLAIGIGFLAVVTYETAISAAVAYSLGRVSAVMLYPLWVAMLFIPLGLALMVLFMALSLVREWKGKGEISH
jgi:TRAP-type C4-dicarboxylate transport system permease small subunit